MFNTEHTLKVLDKFQNDLDIYQALCEHLRDLVESRIQIISAEDLSNYVTISSLQSWATRLGCGGTLYKEDAFPRPTKYPIDEVAYILSSLLPPVTTAYGR